CFSSPLFPLPNVVLFPRTHLSLHIFEPRYLAMMEEVMAGARRMALCQLRPGWEKDYEAAPPLFRVAGSGRVLLAEHNSDGTWDILLEGIERVALREEIRSEPFRVALVEPIAEGIPIDELEETREAMLSVAKLAEALGRQIPMLRRQLTNLVNTHQHPGVVCDVVAACLVADGYARQSLLAERNILRRLRLLSIQLDSLVASLRERGLEVPPPQSE
ncbi:MAG: LON peptidase substrate-binding domain-containing protein, partial [Candidatus Sumerlaeia bacterium]|nr:LON peptidase substrate-binding domain-containing protein [Candidatus Sumerlaeia bacterium]